MNSLEELLVVIKVIVWIVSALFIPSVPVVLGWWLKKRDIAAKEKADKEEAFITETNSLLQEISNSLKLQTRVSRRLQHQVNETGKQMENLDKRVKKLERHPSLATVKN